MGVIKRQSFKRSFIAYVGVGIGLLSTLFIYPLELRVYGKIQFLISLSVLLTPVASLGIRTLAVRFFPQFRDEAGGHHGFLGLLSLGSLLAFGFFSLLVILSRPLFYWGLVNLGFQKSVFAENLLIIGLITFAYIFIELYSNYASNFQRVAVPELLSNFSLKLGLPLLILGFHYGLFPEGRITHLLVGLFVFMAASLALYLRRLGQWHFRIDWSFFTPAIRRAMAAYALYNMMMLLGGVLAFRIDSIMVTSLIDERTNGIYNIALFMTNTIVIPFQSVNVISAPIVADHMTNNRLGAVRELYEKASLNLFLIGGYLFALLYLALDDLLRISTNYNDLLIIKNVVLVLGFAKLIDMVTGVNNLVIGYSRYYRFNFFAILLMGVLNVLMNYWLIPRYHIMGAAAASLISLFVYNLAKYVFILYRFGMQPFTLASLKVLALLLTAYALTAILPRTTVPLFNLALVGGIFTLLFWLPALYFRLSPDIHDSARGIWKNPWRTSSKK